VGGYVLQGLLLAITLNIFKNRKNLKIWCSFASQIEKL
jgi:hypothetical protein